MARIRTVKPEFYAHERLSELPAEWHLLAGALLNLADDHGFFNANPALVIAGTLPLRPTLDVSEALKALAAIGYVRLGAGPDGRRYGQVVNFAKHQRVNRPSPKTLIDGISVTWDEGSVSPHGGLTEDSVRAHGGLTEGSLQEGNGREGNGREVEGSAHARTAPPSTSPEDRDDPDGRADDPHRSPSGAPKPPTYSDRVAPGRLRPAPGPLAGSLPRDHIDHGFCGSRFCVKAKHVAEMVRSYGAGGEAAVDAFLADLDANLGPDESAGGWLWVLQAFEAHLTKVGRLKTPAKGAPPSAAPRELTVDAPRQDIPDGTTAVEILRTTRAASLRRRA